MLGRARKREGVDAHGRHDDAAQEALEALAVPTDAADAFQGLEIALGEAQIANGADDPAALDQEGMFSGNGPYGLGAGSPWPVERLPSRAAVCVS